MLPPTSLPRTPRRRPVSTDATIATANIGSSTRPAADGLSPRPSSSHCV